VLLVFAIGPAIAHLISAALIARFPLDAAAYAAVRVGLDRRELPEGGLSGRS
jgi:GPH family glycoside/pentoside/hexuronide:cation symporter